MQFFTVKNEAEVFQFCGSDRPCKLNLVKSGVKFAIINKSMIFAFCETKSQMINFRVLFIVMN